MSPSFPDVVLPAVLDFMDLDVLLLSAMPVSRHWREQAIEHRTYWGQIELFGRISHILDVPKYVESEELFRLRLSRTHLRPIDVTLAFLTNPRAVLPAIRDHMHHIRRLSVNSDIRHWWFIIQALTGMEALILESLKLDFTYYSDEQSRVFRATMPRYLFAEAHALRELHLINIELPSSDDLPACFEQLTTLGLESCGDHRACHLPNVFPRCRQLRSLHLGGPVLLADPAFREVATWDGTGLTQLTLYDRYPAASWEALALPLARVPHIRLTSCSAAGVAALARALGPRLALELPRRGDDSMFAARLTGAGGGRCARVDMPLPEAAALEVPAGESPAIAALGDAAVAGRLVRLSFALEDWGDLVGRGYLADCPALEHLVITVHRPADAGWTPARHILCPRLETLVVRADVSAARPVVEAAKLVSFATGALANSAFPVVLELSGLILSGSLAGYENIFSRCVLSS